ncbi:hypothetical protein OFP00_33690, partial [Escherichia coli]|nr:hypothetical protein [Escherichia coli]
EITPLLRKYVASIEMKPSRSIDYHVAFNPEVPERTVVADGHEPSSLYVMRLTNTSDYQRTARDTVIEDILQRISNARVLDIVREESSL